jgi:hypothetical protein
VNPGVHAGESHRRGQGVERHPQRRDAPPHNPWRRPPPTQYDPKGTATSQI